MDNDVSTNQKSNDFVNLDGASSGDEGSSSAQSELEMIVWLKGDESYCDEFIHDAEAAMEQLGIKRSRLTQISGRELRVGRIRVGRYIKPMYRATDLADYKKWTRATASHVRSSNVLKEAADQLAENQDQLYEKIETSLDKLAEDLGHTLSGVTEETYRIQRDQYTQLTEHVSTLLEDAQGDTAAIDGAMNRLQGSFVETMQTVKDLQDGLSDDLRGRIEQMRAEQCSALGMLDESMTLARQTTTKLDSIELASTESYELMFDGISQLKTNFESVGRFNARLADALSKVIECQRESMLAGQSQTVQILRAIEGRPVEAPKAIQPSRSLPSRGRLSYRRRRRNA